MAQLNRMKQKSRESSVNSCRKTESSNNTESGFKKDWEVCQIVVGSVIEKKENTSKVRERRHKFWTFLIRCDLGEAEKKVKLDEINKKQERDHSDWVKVHKK